MGSSYLLGFQVYWGSRAKNESENREEEERRGQGGGRVSSRLQHHPARHCPCPTAYDSRKDPSVGEGPGVQARQLTRWRKRW